MSCIVLLPQWRRRPGHSRPPSAFAGRQIMSIYAVLYAAVIEAWRDTSPSRILSDESWIEFLEYHWYTGTAICARIFDVVNRNTTAKKPRFPRARFGILSHTGRRFIPAAGSRDNDLRLNVGRSKAKRQPTSTRADVGCRFALDRPTGN